MSEHELWNELGNLYFISGTYNQAAYAYNRSIQLDSGFGRPYCNLALTYVKQGKYSEAVRLYQRSIELLLDDREKAITWYRLGDVYRHLKDYRDAILAYQQADLLDSELSQDRKESGQVLYGGSDGTANTQSEAPPLSEGQVKPVPAPEEVQIVVPDKGSLGTGENAKPAEEPHVAALDLDPAVEEPIGSVQAEAAREEIPDLEPVELSEGTPASTVLPVEELLVDDMDAPSKQVEAVVSLPGSESAETTHPPEDGTVPVEAVDGSPVMHVEERVDETVTALESEIIPAADVMPGPSVEEIPSPAAALEPVDFPDPESSLLEEDPESGLTHLAAVPAQEELTAVSDAVSDVGASASNEENFTSRDLEPETEVFLPEIREEGLNQWLPITEAESFNTEEVGERVYRPAFEPSQPEFSNYSEVVCVEVQPAPFTPQRYAVEASAAASLDVDVLVQDEFAQPMFIIPEGSLSEGLETLDESGQPDPASALIQEQNEELKEIEREIERFQQVVQLNPRNASAWDTLGTLYKSARRYPDAILAYQQAVVVDPAKAHYHHHLGIIYAVEGRDEDAIKAFQEVIELDPNHSLAHASLGGYYRRMGLEELAQKHIGRAMKNFYSSENEYNRACMEALCGHTEQSIELLRVALKNKQTYVDWVLRDPDLDSIRRDPRFKQLISDYTS